MKNATETTPRLYVGTYAKYNSGSIFGAWIDLADYADADDFYAACKELHKDEDDPELMFQDYEGFPERLYGESGGVSEIYEYLDLVADMSDDEKSAFEEYIDDGNGVDVDDFRDAWCGKYGDMKAYAEELADELGYYDAMEKAGMSELYFDIDAFARDVECDYWVSDTGNVFSRC